MDRESGIVRWGPDGEPAGITPGPPGPVNAQDRAALGRAVRVEGKARLSRVGDLGKDGGSARARAVGRHPRHLYPADGKVGAKPTPHERNRPGWLGGGAGKAKMRG